MRINTIMCRNGSVHCMCSRMVGCCYCLHSFVEFRQMIKPTAGPRSAWIFLEASSCIPAADYNSQNWENMIQDHCSPPLESLRPWGPNRTFKLPELPEGKADRLLGRKILLIHPLLYKLSSPRTSKGPDLSNTHITLNWPCLQLHCAKTGA